MSDQLERVARAIDPAAFDTESAAGQKWYRYRAQRRRDAESKARAVLEALRPELEDAERLNWMILKSARVVHSMDGDVCWVEYDGEPEGRGYERLSTSRKGEPRDEIDAARQEGKP
jgi:hypothetical protein